MIKLLRRLNPFTSLFGKIFIWFWLTVIIMLSSAFFVGKLVNQTNQISQPDPQVVEKHRKIFDELTQLLERGVPIGRAIRRVRPLDYPLITAINLETNDIKVSFPAPVVREPLPRFAQKLTEFAQSQDVLLLKTPHLEIIGPFDLRASDNEYVIFASRLLRRDEQLGNHITPVLLLILVVGTLLCVLLAWRLSKPLQQLREATNKISGGDLNARITGYEQRRDEIGELARDFNQMTQKLSSSIEQQQLLMANISHELRTPLTRLQLASAMLESADMQPRVTQNIARIEREIRVMDNLIGQAIELARMSLSQLSTAFTPDFESIELNEVLGDVLMAAQFETEVAGKSLQFDQLSSPINLSIHRATIVSALENLLRNAIRFARTTIRIDVQAHHSSVYIYVSDDGEGMNEQQFQDYLKPFIYAKHTASDHQSYGLGLAIAEAGITMHKGMLSWERPRLGGTTLCVRLPYRQP